MLSAQKLPLAVERRALFKGFHRGVSIDSKRLNLSLFIIHEEPSTCKLVLNLSQLFHRLLVSNIFCKCGLPERIKTDVFRFGEVMILDGAHDGLVDNLVLNESSHQLAASCCLLALLQDIKKSLTQFVRSCKAHTC